MKGREKLFRLGQDTEVWEVDQWFGEFGRPSGATYASNTQCKQMYVQISCLSVHSDGISSVFRIDKMARVASSLVMVKLNGQVAIVVSAGISFPAMIL